MTSKPAASDIRCFIFDLDGTLVFNEQANFLAYQTAFKTHGLELAEKDFTPYFRDGGHIEDIFEGYVKKYDLRYDEALLRKIKESKPAEYAARLHLIEQNHAIVGLLSALSAHYPTALATTAQKKNAMALVEHFGLEQYFNFMVFGDDVAHKKPAPECHQIIAAHFGVQPEQCLIFEDSPKGFAAAEAFGGHICKVVQ